MWTHLGSRHALLTATALLLIPFATACGDDGAPAADADVAPDVAQILVIADFDRGSQTVPAYADSLRVTVTAPSGVALPNTFPNPFLLNRTNGQLHLADLEANEGAYLFDMAALTGDVVVGTAQRSVAIAADDFLQIDVSANLDSQVESVVVEGAGIVQLGEAAPFTAFAKDSEGATLFTNGFEWSSSDTASLTVHPEIGLVTAISLGSAMVRARLRGSLFTAELEVLANTKIAYVSDRDGNFEIYTMNTDGSDPVRLTDELTSDLEPTFSHDGSKLAFSGAQGGGTLNIFSMDRDGQNVMQLTTDGFSYRPAYHPSGQQILFSSDRDGDQEIYVMDADGQNVVKLTDNAVDDSAPSISDDGLTVAFRSTRDGISEIYLMDIDGSDQRRITTNSVAEYDPVISSDGSRVLFRRSDHIYIVDATGFNETQLTSNTTSNSGPTFSPSGSHIAFTGDQGGMRNLYLMKLETGTTTRLTESGINIWADFD